MRFSLKFCLHILLFFLIGQLFFWILYFATSVCWFKLKRTLFVHGLLPANAQLTSDFSKCGYLIRSPWDGRLGSQMFAYASFYGMTRNENSKKFPIILTCEKPSSLDQIFDSLSLTQESIFCPTTIYQIKEKNGCCKYEKIEDEYKKCDGMNFYFSGFRMSFKYFLHVENEIRREFEFTSHIKEQCHNSFNQLLSTNDLSYENCIIIGVHLRRGDFNEAKNLHYGHWPAQSIYFKNVIIHYENMFRNKTANKKFWRRKTKKRDCLVFLIFGNDQIWNKQVAKEIDLNEKTRLIFADNRSEPAVDLCMMTLCDHMAISTGSFGWWAGFLNGGVVAYQKEFARQNSQHYHEYEPSDYFLPQWVGL